MAIVIRGKKAVKRSMEPVSVGYPFRKGQLQNINDISLSDSRGSEIDVQAAAISFWTDGSIKWALLDFQPSVEGGEEKSYSVSLSNKSSLEQNGIIIGEEGGKLTINTGIGLFEISNKSFINAYIVNGETLVQGEQLKLKLIGVDGNEYFPENTGISIESGGKLRSTIKMTSEIILPNGYPLRLITMLHFFYEKSYVKAEITIHNPGPAKHDEGLWDLGDKGSVYFKGLLLSLPVMEGLPGSIRYRDKEDGSLQEFSGDKFSIYQESSGGDNWSSVNHINREGKIPLTFKGYKISGDGREISSGDRATPIISVNNGEKGIAVAIREFWQNFPKSIDVEKNTINVSLFPVQFPDDFELQGGEQKTHSLYIDFSADAHALNWVHDPLVPAISPEWIEETGVLPYFYGASRYVNEDFELLTSRAVEGENSFFERREIIDEYGWRNFGELYADHETMEHKDRNIFISHYNNQYDFIYSAFRQYLSKGDERWFELMSDLARHVIDIDIYHTDKDRAEYNQGLFWHTNHYLDAATSTHRSFSKAHKAFINPAFCGGGPGLEHNYTAGLTCYSLFTGDDRAREAVLGIAHWVSNNLEPTSLVGTLFNLRRKKATLNQVLKGEKIRSDLYPFTRGSGNSINALLDAFSLTGDRKYLDKSELIIKGCIHPADNIESRGLLNAEACWSYTVCLQAIGKYLDTKVELAEQDETFCYARDALLHYARWMLENEFPYLDKSEELEYPNETWSGQDLRKSCVFYFAAKYSADDDQKAFLKKAGYFYEDAMKRLKGFKTSSLTRPIVLILQNGPMHGYFQVNSLNKTGFIEEKKYPSRKDEFLTAGLIVKQSLISLLGALKKFSVRNEIHWLKCRLNRQV